ncbi:MAG: AAA family ATPase [Candidatus Thiodiazotropha taylori]|nr:AAA family ATPase [Candidatus Thiodiazotropha taylori]MCW4225547.1 AAA family ATPase [Candidatus Thiodiazotropha endolucinida]MCG7887116.1 AAA family ATPase [Candidatus Thiodiazotropha taylori]MCG8034607.1 AAA family ATPase [Candidatus Thiodiazotropha taylori]MCG8078845.1 AAA family ATPase [Candidatus Thiodiazotropha taylori]
MRIKKIQKITGLGIFRDFSWDENLPEFEDFNLVYGWNYSGKTTLSRIFDGLGKPELISQLNGTFEVLDADDNTLRSANVTDPQNCRVFNRDFIDRNFRQEHNAPAVFIVGDDAAKIRDRISTLEARKARVNQADTTYTGQKSDWERRVNDGLKRDAARTIGELVSERSFRRPDLDGILEQIKDSLDDHLLEETEFDALNATASSSDDFAEYNSFTIPNIDISALVEEVGDLLGQTASNNAIGRLKDNAALEAWVRTGRDLHSSGDECAFCGNKIQDARFEQLKGHFSTEYEALVKAVQDKAAALRVMEIKAVLPESGQLIHSVREEYSEAISPISTFVESANGVIPLLVDALEGKVSSIETEKTLPETVSDALANVTAYEYSDKHKEIDGLLKTHNEQIGDMEATKRDAKSKLKKHSAARFYRDNLIATEEEKYAEIEAKQARARDVRTTIAAQIEEKEDEIKEHSVAVAKLNDLIAILLTGSNISAVQLSESEFEFRRGTEPAVNLSDGERTAIDFAYFLLTLEDGGNDLGNTLVFVDDPISSLDSNHIYAVYALIIDRLKGQCEQLFISTHNYEFLNLLKDEALNGKRNFKTGCAGYLAQRAHDDQGEPFAELVEMPKALRKFKSEYQFLFSLLHQLVTSTNTTLHEAYTSPTVLRKFLETYLGFRKPVAGRWSDKLDLLFDVEAERTEVAKFADDASHLQSLKQAVEHGEFIASAKGIVGKVLNALESKDNAHYEGLKTATED